MVIVGDSAVPESDVRENMIKIAPQIKKRKSIITYVRRTLFRAILVRGRGKTSVCIIEFGRRLTSGDDDRRLNVSSQMPLDGQRAKGVRV